MEPLKNLQNRPVIGIDERFVAGDQPLIEDNRTKIQLPDERIVLNEHDIVVDERERNGRTVSDKTKEDKNTGGQKIFNERTARVRLGREWYVQIIICND